MTMPAPCATLSPVRTPDSHALDRPQRGLSSGQGEHLAGRRASVLKVLTYLL